jgi:signal transduction histidine kinase
MSVTTNESYPKLLSLAVHEIRTPVSVVGGYLRMLLRDIDAPLTDRQRKMIEEADKSCARIAALVAELSDVGKIDAGLAPFAKQQLDLFSLVEEVASNMHESRDREVRFEARGDLSGAPVLGDAPRLRAAFQSVFRAILREQPSACTVVALRRIESVGGVRSAVVAAAEQATVQRADIAQTGPFDEKRGGLGLELPIARRVIEGHGGRLLAPLAAPGSDPPTIRSAAIVSIPLRS